MMKKTMLKGRRHHTRWLYRWQAAAVRNQGRRPVSSGPVRTGIYGDAAGEKEAFEIQRHGSSPHANALNSNEFHDHHPAYVRGTCRVLPRQRGRGWATDDTVTTSGLVYTFTLRDEVSGPASRWLRETSCTPGRDW